MNTVEHILTCLAEEGSEVTKDVTKSLRFGLDDRNILNPTGPTNRERLIDELNDLLGVTWLLVDEGVLPPNWMNAEKQIAKKEKVLKFMQYAKEHGALQN